MDKDFHRRMIEEKGLDTETMQVQHTNGEIHMVEMGALLEVIDLTSPDDRVNIHGIMSRIDFLNGDLMHFMNHLAKGYVETNF